MSLMNLSFFFETLRLAVTNLYLHKLRSALTSLGIIIGVGAVITMLAIGEGAKDKAVREVEQLGATNIIIVSVQPPESTQSSSRNVRELSYGIKRDDLLAIQQQAQLKVLPGVELIVPVRDTEQEVVRNQTRARATAVATTPEFLQVANLSVDSGRFLHANDMAELHNVCVLGAGAAEQLFGKQSPIGHQIRIGTRTSKVFDVVGVLKPVGVAGGKSSMTGRDMNQEVYIPLSTAAASFSDTIQTYKSGASERKVIELSEIYVRASDASHVEPLATAFSRLMDVRHAGSQDVAVRVPRELLKTAQKTAWLWSTVMGGIAALSLLIGGIGIMNISLATVTERTREIGIRRALGARQFHIVVQFLIETMTLSVCGGLVGVAVGWGLSSLIHRLFGDSFPTDVTTWSVGLSFVISAAVGVIFGVYPAIVAAKKDPIEALRHD